MRRWFTLGNVIYGLSIFALLSAATFFFSGYQFFQKEFPDVVALRRQYPVVDYEGPEKPFKVHLQRTRPPSWASLQDVSRLAVGAIIVSEDWAFYHHKGYDPNQMKEALGDAWEARTLMRGASTITQQVVKNVFLERDRNLWRKAKELWLAIELEQEVGKRKILETYLNIAEWGEGIFGVKAAARHYFNKAPLDLTAKEGAFLAMLLPSPKKYSVSFKNQKLTDFAKETIEAILGKMTQAKYLTPEERDRELATRLPFEAEEESGDTPGESSDES